MDDTTRHLMATLFGDVVENMRNMTENLKAKFFTFYNKIWETSYFCVWSDLLAFYENNKFYRLRESYLIWPFGFVSK